MSFANIMTMQRLVALINLVLITAGTYFGVGLFYQVAGLQIHESEKLSAQGTAQSDKEVLIDQPYGYYQPVLERDLFKTRKVAQSPSAAKSIDLANLEETQLKLKLWGTVSGDPDQAYAVIEDTQKREQNLYRVGDSIQNATVKMILREKIVINVEGKDETLGMEEGSQGGPHPLMASSGRPSAAIQNAPVRDQRISLQRRMIEEAFQDVNKLMTEIAIAPHTENGQADGLALNSIKPNSVFRRMGLRNGDVLVGVNGQEIRSVEDAMRLYESLRSSPEIQLQLKRRGQERNISYNIR